MSKFLLDANLSPKTRAFLQEVFSFDAEDLLTRDQGLLLHQLPTNDQVFVARPVAPVS